MKEATWYNSCESGIALIFSFIINLFVVCVFAEAYFVEGSKYNPSLVPGTPGVKWLNVVWVWGFKLH